MHPTLGILARFQAFFCASAFFQSDGVPPPAHTQVTQTVETAEKVGESSTKLQGSIQLNVYAFNQNLANQKVIESKNELSGIS